MGCKKRKKKIVAIGAAVLAILCSTLGFSQETSFPQELSGDRFSGVHEYLQFRMSEQFQVPYSIPDPDPDIYFAKRISSGALPPFDISVYSECLYRNETPLVCQYQTKNYEWNGDVGSYCDLEVVSQAGDMTLDCYTWDAVAEVWLHYYGLLMFVGDPHNFDWDWGHYFLDTAQVASEYPSRRDMKAAPDVR